MIAVAVQFLLLQKLEAVSVEDDLEAITSTRVGFDQGEVFTNCIPVASEVLGTDFAQTQDVVA